MELQRTRDRVLASLVIPFDSFFFFLRYFSYSVPLGCAVKDDVFLKKFFPDYLEEDMPKVLREIVYCYMKKTAMQDVVLDFFFC